MRQTARGGLRSCQSVACWYACAARSTVDSSKRRPDERQADRKAVDEPARHAHDGQAETAPRRVERDQRGAVRHPRPTDLDRQVVDPRRHDGHLRGDEDVEPLEQRPCLLDEGATRALAGDRRRRTAGAARRAGAPARRARSPRTSSAASRDAPRPPPGASRAAARPPRVAGTRHPRARFALRARRAPRSRSRRQRRLRGSTSASSRRCDTTPTRSPSMPMPSSSV